MDQYEIMNDGNVEVRDVCEAWDGAMEMYKEEFKEQGIQEGIQQGIQQSLALVVKICKEMSKTKTDTIGQITSYFSFTEKDAEDFVNKYWN
ncbi:MAG: hypothetical protein Q4C91_04945 [Eubacteriales bacterium]|nr:hypothetical protein [Eubacteriales bacterium]